MPPPLPGKGEMNEVSISVVTPRARKDGTHSKHGDDLRLNDVNEVLVEVHLVAVV